MPGSTTIDAYARPLAMTAAPTLVCSLALATERPRDNERPAFGLTTTLCTPVVIVPRENPDSSQVEMRSALLLLVLTRCSTMAKYLPSASHFPDHRSRPAALSSETPVPPPPTDATTGCLPDYRHRPRSLVVANAAADDRRHNRRLDAGVSIPRRLSMGHNATYDDGGGDSQPTKAGGG